MQLKHEFPPERVVENKTDALTEDAKEFRVHLCFGPNCTPRGSRDLFEVFEDAVREAGLQDRVEIIATSCRNRCDYGPSVNVYPGPTFYCNVNEEAIEDIVRDHLIGGKPVARWLVKPEMWREISRKAGG